MEANITAERRFLLWVDAVGGFLICPGNKVVLGQAAPDNRVDLPILGDLSRKHACIRRQGEGYLLEPWHSVRIDGRLVQDVALLSDGAEIELGRGVRLQFRQPHALSASARLDLVSRHRTHPSVDGIVLMAECCVLGRNWNNHVVCPDWSHDVVLSRQNDQLYCRALEPIEIDGQLCDGRGRLHRNSRVVGSDFSLSLEELDKCVSQPLP